MSNTAEGLVDHLVLFFLEMSHSERQIERERETEKRRDSLKHLSPLVTTSYVLPRIRRVARNTLSADRREGACTRPSSQVVLTPSRSRPCDVPLAVPVQGLCLALSLAGENARCQAIGEHVTTLPLQL